VANQPGQRRPSGPAIAVGLVVVSLLVLTSVLGRPVGLPATGVTGWLPADGHRQRLSGPDGVQAGEWTIDQFSVLVVNGPSEFLTWLRIAKADSQAQVARLTTTRIRPSGEVDGRSDNLFSIGADGVRAAVAGGFDGSSLSYVPGRLDLPSDLAAGRSWSSEGGVLIVDAAGKRTTAGYRADYSAATPADHSLLARACVVVTRREQIGQEPASITESTWCRHEGIIGFATAAGRWQATAPTPATVPPEDPFDWSTADRLSFSPRKINNPAMVNNGPNVGNVVLDSMAAPGILPDGTAVFAGRTTGDVSAVQVDTQPPPLLWRARPGLRNTAAATFGTLTLVAAASRQLVAYGAAGEWLWEVRLPDLAVVAPARLGDEAVVATLDGSVSGYDLATGALSWRRQMSSEVRSALIVAGDRVLVVDQNGQLSCFDPTGAELWSVQSGPVAHFAVSTGPDPTVVVPNSDGPRVQGYSLADGSLRWNLRQFLSVEDAIALDGVVVLRDSKEVIGIDPATGQRSWTWAARTFGGIGGASRVLLLVDGALVLLDNKGAKVTSWPVAIGDPSADGPLLSAANSRVLVYSLSGAELGVVAR
jgi:outer membrane protein assembly factor BamB